MEEGVRKKIKEVTTERKNIKVEEKSLRLVEDRLTLKLAIC